jgi:hypothetical protein
MARLAYQTLRTGNRGGVFRGAGRLPGPREYSENDLEGPEPALADGQPTEGQPSGSGEVLQESPSETAIEVCKLAVEYSK